MQGIEKMSIQIKNIIIFAFRKIEA